MVHYETLNLFCPLALLNRDVHITYTGGHILPKKSETSWGVKVVFV